MAKENKDKYTGIEFRTQGFDDPRLILPITTALAQHEYQQVAKRVEQDSNQSYPETMKTEEQQHRFNLSLRYQDFAEYVEEAQKDWPKIEIAQVILREAKAYAQMCGIDWNSLPHGWKIFENKLQALIDEIKKE